MSEKPLYTIPIDQRPPHGPLTSKIFFPLIFNLAQLGINSAQFLCLPLLLIPIVGRGWFDSAIGWTKDGYGRLRESISRMVKANGSHRHYRVIRTNLACIDYRYTPFNHEPC
ncbi:hypothetical protein I203_108230 [Kwoniella mangroviensis CBS 8507]|uniref:hypothetical protein n=1 Tax=Kwoniella mangroviensis CBS 8507 TaxID=1296122 RepID=UPI00304AB488